MITGCRGYNSSQKRHQAQDVAASRKMIVALCRGLCKTDSVTKTENSKNPRQIDVSRPFDAVAAPVHGRGVQNTSQAGSRHSSSSRQRAAMLHSLRT